MPLASGMPTHCSAADPTGAPPLANWPIMLKPAAAAEEEEDEEEDDDDDDEE